VTFFGDQKTPWDAGDGLKQPMLGILFGDPLVGQSSRYVARLCKKPGFFTHSKGKYQTF
jgi:hypothetical protein